MVKCLTETMYENVPQRIRNSKAPYKIAQDKRIKVGCAVKTGSGSKKGSNNKNHCLMFYTLAIGSSEPSY